MNGRRKSSEPYADPLVFRYSRSFNDFSQIFSQGTYSCWYIKYIHPTGLCMDGEVKLVSEKLKNPPSPQLKIKKKSCRHRSIMTHPLFPSPLTSRLSRYSTH